MNETLVIWDIEWHYSKFLDVVNLDLFWNKREVDIILAWDIVWKWPNNIELLTHLMNSKNNIQSVLWNKDYLVQQLISGENMNCNKKWVNSLSSELEKYPKLQDFFMDLFNPYLEIYEGKFIVTHAHIRWNLDIDQYSKEELIGIGRTTWKKFNKKWQILIHWHKPNRVWPQIKYNSKGRILSIWIDTWAWKGGKLSGVLLGENKMSFVSSS